MAKKISNIMPLEELESYIDRFIQSDSDKYSCADWLISSFDDPIWKIKCHHTIEINWMIRLSNGELLTSPPHAKLLNSLRSWLVLQTHSDLSNGKIFEPRTVYARLVRVILCIDYLLLRSKFHKLHIHGLDSITNNDIKAMISKISQSYSINDSIYEFNLEFTLFLRNQISNLDNKDLDIVLRNNPWLSKDIPHVNDRQSSLSEDEILLARAWLWRNDLYEKSSKYEYDLKLSELTRNIYADTLWGSKVNFKVPCELRICPLNEYKSEYLPARITSNFDRRMNSKELSRIVTTILSLNLILNRNQSFIELDKEMLWSYTTNLNLKPSGRFKTLPHNVVSQALHDAIELVVKFGDTLIDSFLEIAKAANNAKSSNQTLRNYLLTNDISKFIPKKALEFGITRWKINSRVELRKSTSIKASVDYYASLRSNDGLYESMRVLYGAFQIILGTLSAQRSGSLIELYAGKCLDTSRSRLVFYNKKSGHSGLNQKLSRPIPPIAVSCIDKIERLQEGLISIGILDMPVNLFSFPNILNISSDTIFSKTKYYDSIDFFCDWAELPLDSDGRRYYIRQHQLRRHFAMLFFWGGGFGSMDSLRWFLGHTNVEHLWHYITESTPGLTLRSIAAEWAAYGVIHATPEAKLLSEELFNHFGTYDFTVLEKDVLQLYLEDLIEENRLIIEPQFLDGGHKYKIAIVLRPKMDLPT